MANPNDEIESVCDYNVEEDPDSVEENKNIFLHLISQLKLGMDLTKVFWLNWFINFKIISILKLFVIIKYLILFFSVVLNYLI